MDISYYLIPSILANVKTGNIYHDCLIIIVVLFCINLLSQSITKLINYIMEKISNMNFKKKASSSYTINIKMNLNSNDKKEIELPKEYFALLHYMMTNNIDVVKARNIPQIKRQIAPYGFQENHDKIYNITDYLIEAVDPIWLGNNIYLEAIKSAKENENNNNISYDYILYSKKYDFTKLKQFIIDITKQYDEYIIEYEKKLDRANDGKHYHFTYLRSKNPDYCSRSFTAGISYDNEDQNIKYYENKYELQKLQFNTNKTFDNIFFEQKEILKQRLDFFLKNPDYYKKLGIPHSFGLMFYGKPGCGKTSAIKAIAKYTKRHIVEIPLSRIKKFGELKDIFFMDKYNHVDLSFENKIIVFEDIDCMSDIIKKRDINNDNIKIKTNNEVQDENSRITINGDFINCKLTDTDIESKQIVLMRSKILNLLDVNQEDPITLQNILNLIDGIIEQPGRILIFTTNHPDQLDDALIRPGRVDLQLEFKLCSNEIIKNIITHIYSQSIPDDIKFPEYKYTAAEVIQLCMNENDFDRVIKKLNELNN